MSTISLFEFKRVPQNLLTDEEIKALTRSDPRLIELDYSKGEIIPQNYVGVIKPGQRTIEILPKIYKEPIEQNRTVVTRNLLKMLDYSEFFGIHEFDFAELAEIRDYNILEIIISIFARRLLDTLQSQPFREYSILEEVLGTVRGRIDFNRYMNPATIHRIPCVYNERTTDNTLNRTLRYVSHLLSGTVSSDNTFSCLRNIVDELDGVSLMPVNVQQVDGIIFNRLNEQYKPFIDLCKVFLQGSGISLQHSSLETFTFVIPMERLFESFVTTLLTREKSILPRAKVEQKPRIGYLASDTKGNRYFEMTPDNLVHIGDRLFVVDTKYKMISGVSDIQQEDAYQMYAYATTCKADGVLLLYPDFGSGKSEKLIHLDLTAPTGYKRNTIDLYVGKVRFDYDLVSQWGEFLQHFARLIKITIGL